MHLRALFAGLAVAAAFLLVPNAHAQEARDCSRVDWQAVGYQDAEQRGSPADATSWVEQHQRTCVDVVGVDEAAYEAGFIQGLTAFCIPRRAFDLARAGQTYVGWCPADQAEAFALGLRDGRRVRMAESVATTVRQEERRQQWREREQRERLRQQQVDRARDRVANTAMSGASLSDLLFNQGDRGWDDTMRETRTQRRIAEVRAEDAALAEAVVAEDLEALRAELGDRYGAW